MIPDSYRMEGTQCPRTDDRRAAVAYASDGVFVTPDRCGSTDGPRGHGAEENDRSPSDKHVILVT